MTQRVDAHRCTHFVHIEDASGRVPFKSGMFTLELLSENITVEVHALKNVTEEILRKITLFKFENNCEYVYSVLFRKITYKYRKKSESPFLELQNSLKISEEINDC